MEEDRSPRWRSRPPKGPRQGSRKGKVITTDDGAIDEEKFIGGAERARRDAKKRQRCGDFGHTNPKRNHHTRSISPKSKNIARLSKKMKPMDRFFASLFLSSVEEFIKSDDSDDSRARILSDICVRLGLPMPANIPSESIDAHHFYSQRGSLVMEEARFVIAESLRKYKPSEHPHRKPHRGVPSTFLLRLVSVEEKEKLGATVFAFGKERSNDKFTPQELQDMRPGCCFEILVLDKVKDSTGRNMRSILGNVVPTADRQSIDYQLSLMVYQKLKVDEDLAGEELWEVRPLTTLISEVRQFDACTRAQKVPFLPKLLGWKESSHIFFDDSDEDSSGDNDSEKSVRSLSKVGQYSHDTTVEIPSRILLPRLNPTQERAASAYLASPPSTLTLIQGPPGTGKTTFTVSCIIRCLFEKSGRRLLVTAPTNKAITVLASRFLAALNGDDDSFNVVMIGVEDKLVEKSDMRDGENHMKYDGDGNKFFSPSSLRDIFVYTWIDTIQEQFQLMLNCLRPDTNLSGLAVRAQKLRKKVKTGIPSTFGSSETKVSLAVLIRTLEQTSSINEIASGISNVISSLSLIDSSAAVQELLATADVIFSTLSTAGVSAMKHTKKVTDLICDEAAAATEPEILIPLHLRPDRMLAVGDPRQLPATIMSPNAARMGLDRSLHQRLMYECGHNHIMLDLQYRMKPCISAFPSKAFYDSKLLNGENVMHQRYGNGAAIPFGGKPFVFFQINGSERQYMSGSYCNNDEAYAVVEYIKKLKATADKGNAEGPWYSPDRIRVITFYQAQVSTIQRLLHKNRLGQVLVATVDSSQGCEADIVIISFVRSNTKRGSIRHTAGFLCDERRLNVALTRAKYQVVCIGNANGTLSASEDSILSKLVQEARDRKCIVSL